MAIQERFATADDLIELASLTDTLTELTQGEIVEMPPAGDIHTLLSSFMHFTVYGFALDNKLPGYVTDAQGGYKLASDPDIVRAPDVGYILKSRVEKLTGKHFAGAPDLAIEVISPYDRAEDVQEKINEYLTYGTRIVWAIYYRSRSVVVHKPTGAITLHEDDTLDGEDILPGFNLLIRDIFAILESDDDSP